MCGRSCVRGSFLLPCCGAKLVPLPLSRAGMPCCGRGGTAQGRRGAGTRVSERSRSGRGGGRRARRAPPPPPPNGRRRAHGRAEFPRPLLAALPPAGRRAWPCPRPRPPRARATPNGRAGRERAAAAARAPGRSRDPGAPRGQPAGLSRSSPSPPRARRSFPAPATGSSLVRPLFSSGGVTKSRGGFGLVKQRCCSLFYRG